MLFGQDFDDVLSCIFYYICVILYKIKVLLLMMLLFIHVVRYIQKMKQSCVISRFHVFLFDRINDLMLQSRVVAHRAKHATWTVS